MPYNSKRNSFIFKSLFKQGTQSAIFLKYSVGKGCCLLQGTRDSVGCNGKRPCLLAATVNS